VRDADASQGTFPLILYSHAAGQHRRVATFVCTHLASHGYIVAALDHSEVIAPELGRQTSETEQQKQARWAAVIASRVPDIHFLLNFILENWQSPAQIDRERIGIVGHSFGAWTALAAPDAEPAVRAVVAHAPGGASKPRPGILPVTLAFDWDRDVPTLFLAAENDAALPLDGMYETFESVPATRQMVILRRADHMHFIDEIEALHEGFRTMPAPPELAAMQADMLPITELTRAPEAQLFVRGLTLAHFDGHLKGSARARDFLAGDLEAELARHKVEAVAQPSQSFQGSTIRHEWRHSGA
jgi:predicted dienelactone hydrolase